MPITDELRDQLWRKAAIVLRQHFNLNVAEATSNLVDAIIPIIAAREASARREALREVAEVVRERCCGNANVEDLTSEGRRAKWLGEEIVARILSLSPAIPAAGGGDEEWFPIASAPEGEIVEIGLLSRDGSWWTGTGKVHHCPEADRGERIPDNWAEVLHYNGEVLVGCFYATHWRPRQSPPASAPNPGPSDDDGTQEVVT
jgi:hypothetical protein